MPAPCLLCGDSGLQIIERPDGSRAARECACRVERRSARLIARTRIPRRYEHCTLDNYEVGYASATDSLKEALFTSRNFVHLYPNSFSGVGLLFTGAVGVGKTHLAVGILQALVRNRQVKGIFYDYRELLKEIQNSYNREVKATELEILAPVFEADVLVLDELGAAKPSEWVSDTVSLILNSRYNDRRTTIVTTNLPNSPEMLQEAQRRMNDPQKAMYKETLGDRIGERMRSRLQEMCVAVEMSGQDFRQGPKQARNFD